jgi:hypothetical protein
MKKEVENNREASLRLGADREGADQDLIRVSYSESICAKYNNEIYQTDRSGFVS